MRVHSRRILIAVLALSLPLLVPACGGGGGGGGGDDSGGDDGFRVLETSPRHKELAVELDSTVELVFSEALDPDTLAADSVRLS